MGLRIMTVSTPTTALTLPTTDAEAIVFALDNLQPWEVAAFLGEWREGKNLQSWLEALEEDRAAT